MLCECLPLGLNTQNPKSQTQPTVLNIQKWKEKNMCSRPQEWNLLGCAQWQWQKKIKRGREEIIVAPGKGRQQRTKTKQNSLNSEAERVEEFCRALLKDGPFSIYSHWGPQCLLLPLLWCVYFLLCFYHDVATRKGSFCTSLRALHV